MSRLRKTGNASPFSAIKEDDKFLTRFPKQASSEIHAELNKMVSSYNPLKSKEIMKKPVGSYHPSMRIDDWALWTIFHNYAGEPTKRLLIQLPCDLLI